MAPTDGSVYAYVGHTRNDSAEETYTLLQGTGMPATHELAIGWDGNQLTFYVDGQARKSLPTKQIGPMGAPAVRRRSRRPTSPAASTM